jgi:P4 family phage/plasmid primase-like protien
MSDTDNRQLLKDAIAALTILDVWKRLGIPGNPKIGDNKSPLRNDDRESSFSIYDQSRKAKDHGGLGFQGDSYNFYCAYTGRSPKEAFVPFVELAGLGHRLNGNGKTDRVTPAFNWTQCVSDVTDVHLGQLSSWRVFGLPYCRRLVAEKVIARYQDRWAFPVIDDHGIVIGCHILADPEKKRWQFAPAGNKAWPLVLGDLKNAEEVHFCESNWDGLSVYEHMSRHAAVVVTRGAQHASKIGWIDIPQKAKLFVWAQNDKPKADGTIPSEKWFEDVKKELTVEFYRVRTPEQYADPNEWTKAGGTLEDLRRAMEDAERCAGLRGEKTNGKTPHAPELTEAERVALLEPSLPPIHVWEKDWYAYQHGFWQKTDRDIYRPSALLIMPEFQRSAKKAKETLDHLEGLRQLPTDRFRDANRFDGEDILLNIANGVLRIRRDGTGQIENSSKDHYFCAQMPCIYDDAAEAPLFEKAVVQALPDPKDQELFMLWNASILLPSSEFETALCCYGHGGTGKSTLAVGIQAAIGPHVTRFLTMKEICSEQGYHVPQLRRAMLNVSTELDAVLIENSENFKRLISGEEFMARNIYGKPFVMSTVCKLLFLTNHLPRFKSGTNAELRRLRFLRFENMPIVDTTLKSRIILERDGIFRLLVEYLARLLKLKAMPYGGAASETTLQRFAVTNDPVGSFVKGECLLDPKDFTAKTLIANRFNAYLDKIGLSASIGDNFFKILYDRYPSLSQSRLRSGQIRENVVVGIGMKETVSPEIEEN